MIIARGGAFGAGLSTRPARGNEFSGTVRWAQIDVDQESADHLVHPEDRLRVIMARQ